MKIKRVSIKVLPKLARLVALWVFVLACFSTQKSDPVNQNTQKIDKKDEINPVSSEDKGDNNFLFVDCTGFFE